MSKGGHLATEFEWVAGGENGQSSQLHETSPGNFKFLKEGYLHMIEEETDHLPHGVYTSTAQTAAAGSGNAGVRGAHAVLVRKTSGDSTIKGAWRKRWCVLSQTADGVHLLYYKHEHSFTNCEAPLGVVLMEGCQKLYTVPNHSKSSGVWAVAFPYRILMFHPDKGSDLQGWLEAFETALDMKDSSTSSPLKGLPKQKALRKDIHTRPWPRGHEMPTEKHKNDGGSSGEVAEVVAFRHISEEADGEKDKTSELKGLPRKKALHNRRKNPEEKKLFEDVAVPELDTEEKGAVQFLGYRTLDT